MISPLSGSVIDDIPIIDTDTHVVEPPDLWTSRISSKWGDLVPHVEWDEEKEEEAWFTGSERLGAVGGPAMAGWHEHPPFHPRRFADTDPKSWNATERAALMDAYGVRSQILYPNVAVFDAKSIVNMGDTALQLACIQAYNDFLVDFANEAPGRFIPATGLPFWDLDATLAEIERCAANGHKGIVFTQDPSYFGLPPLTDRYWDPMWASAQEKGLPVNFHIASGDLDLFNTGHPDNGIHANYAAMGVSFFLANAVDDRPAHHRRHLPPIPGAQLRVGRERHRLDPVRPRGARLAMAQLRRAQGAPRVRAAAERVLPPADLWLLLVRA